jgi:serralysin
MTSCRGRCESSDIIEFAPSIAPEDLWFALSGNDLEIDLIGTSNEITISDWQHHQGALKEISAGSAQLTNKISSLINAMATFTANNAGFDPETAALMPQDAALRDALASAWQKAA